VHATSICGALEFAALKLSPGSRRELNSARTVKKRGTAPLILRASLDSSRGHIPGQILNRGCGGGIGVVLGLIGAALLSRSMTTLLFNVRPTDPAVYAAVSFALIGVALLASYLPARGASRIDPLVALRLVATPGRIGPPPRRADAP
jgi:hypothetical protein